MEFHTNFKSGEENITKVCSCGKPRMTGRRKCLQCISALNRQKKILKLQRLDLRKQKKKEKRENHYKLVSKKAWNLFAKSLKQGKDYFTCYTCGKVLPIEQAQAGHCFHRGKQRYKALDFDPKHIRLQCGGCNCFSTGQTNIFQAKLTRELGIEEVEKMIWRRHNELPLTVEELKDLIKFYQEKICNKNVNF